MWRILREPCASSLFSLEVQLEDRECERSLSSHTRDSESEEEATIMRTSAVDEIAHKGEVCSKNYQRISTASCQGR